MNTESNALTEVALALAMAFFAIFVLTAVSMGLPQAEAVKPGIEISTIEFSSQVGETRTLQEEEMLVIYADGAYFDQSLKLFEPQRFPQGRYVLAVSPAVSLVEIIEARQRIASGDVSITLLDEAWMARLKEIKRQ